MSNSLPTTPATQDQASRMTQLLVVFTASIFLSAALLFAVQPMFTKMVLPRLGGAPGVWSVAMVFFQACLLAGYGYAHLLTKYAPGRRSVMIHLGLMVVACFWLPLSIASNWGRPPVVGEAFWLLGMFAVSIGPPFFALAANAPLLQAWFARTDHPSASDPYFLYAASNIGSFLALLSYPILIEPLITLTSQTWIWAAGFIVLILLIAGCGYLLWQSPDKAPAAVAPETAAAKPSAIEAAPPTWGNVVRWVFLAAVPSGLLVAVTAHISTDVAAVPLLWVIPLALYLLTFVIVFSRQPIIPHWLVVEVQPVFVLALVAVIVFEPIRMIVGIMAVHLIVFFVLTLMCHGELASRRPPARYLTSFYMWMSFGGMVGGIASGLAAPYVFNWIAEYPILITLAVLCRPGLTWPKTTWQQAIVFGSVVLAIILTVLFRQFEQDISISQYHMMLGALLILTVLFWRDPVPFAAIVATVLLAHHHVQESGSTLTLRSFFGVMKVNETMNGQFRTLSHGTTLHGGQRILDKQGKPVTGRPQPTMYYYDGSAIAQGMDAVKAVKGGPINYAVIGLGTGSLICRSQPGDKATYYEIDALMVRLARDMGMFTFLKECGQDVPIVMGDARLTLADAPDGAYDLIVVDAFTSDAIPIHLLTKEAMAIYKRKLSPNGIVLIHISNRHLELGSVVTGIADANDMVTRISESGDVTEDDSDYKFLGTVTVSARKDEDFGPLAKSQYWELQRPNPRQRVWTDDYSNIVGALIRQLRQ
ncbi:MAG: fused MFS/spermidine synthase [Xanthobacteraceae bacterium]|nr:fused MFS/spermidine synthase [Xanthobacteraceae bacterium]